MTFWKKKYPICTCSRTNQSFKQVKQLRFDPYMRNYLWVIILYKYPGFGWFQIGHSIIHLTLYPLLYSLAVPLKFQSLVYCMSKKSWMEFTYVHLGKPKKIYLLEKAFRKYSNSIIWRMSNFHSKLLYKMTRLLGHTVSSLYHYISLIGLEDENTGT